MYFIRKLRPVQLNIEHIFGMLMAPALIVAFLWGGVSAFFYTIAVLEGIVMLFQINLYIRTKNSAYIAMSVAFLMITIFAIYMAIAGLEIARETKAPLAALVLFSTVIILYIVLTKRTKWRTREILELAAMPVKKSENGFTERPLPLGKISGTKQEIEAFSRFLQQKLIAISHFENGKVVFSLAFTYPAQIGIKRGYNEDSWVSFDSEGNVNVSISKRDYLQYKERYSFDQLCSNLGNLFIEFFELFKNGEGIRIIDRLNSLKLNPIIE